MKESGGVDARRRASPTNDPPQRATRRQPCSSEGAVRRPSAQTRIAGLAAHLASAREEGCAVEGARKQGALARKRRKRDAPPRRRSKPRCGGVHRARRGDGRRDVVAGERGWALWSARRIGSLLASSWTLWMGFLRLQRLAERMLRAEEHRVLHVQRKARQWLARRRAVRERRRAEGAPRARPAQTLERACAATPRGVAACAHASCGGGAAPPQLALGAVPMQSCWRSHRSRIAARRALYSRVRRGLRPCGASCSPSRPGRPSWRATAAAREHARRRAGRGRARHSPSSRPSVPGVRRIRRERAAAPRGGGLASSSLAQQAARRAPHRAALAAAAFAEPTPRGAHGVDRVARARARCVVRGSDRVRREAAAACTGRVDEMRGRRQTEREGREGEARRRADARRRSGCAACARRGTRGARGGARARRGEGRGEGAVARSLRATSRRPRRPRPTRCARTSLVTRVGEARSVASASGSSGSTARTSCAASRCSVASVRRRR